MSRNNSKHRKEERRESAAERQADYDALSDEDKLSRVASRVDDVTQTNEYRKINGGL